MTQILSKNNHKCIGPCYEKNTDVIHPSELIHITNKKYSFCPIKKIKTYDGNAKLYDECLVSTNNKNVDHYIYIEYNKLTYKQFLIIHYKIDNYIDFLNYIEKNELSLNTHIRFIDIICFVFFKNINFLLPYIKKICLLFFDKRLHPKLKNDIDDMKDINDIEKSFFKKMISNILTDDFLDFFLFTFFKQFENIFINLENINIEYQVSILLFDELKMAIMNDDKMK